MIEAAATDVFALKNVILALLVLLAVSMLAAYAVAGIRSFTAQADAITGDVVTRYVELIEAGQFDEAWRDCLTEELRKETPQAEFVSAHRERLQEFGPLQGWKQTDYQHEANLFSSESLIGINGVLHYERRDVFVLYKVDSAVQPFRIKQIFGSSDRSSTLHEGTW